MKKKQFVITDEKDKCIICDRQIYQDKFITKTKEGFICYKCKNFKRDEICLIGNFQDFGNVLFLLRRRLLKNVYGKKLSNPIWEGFIIDAKDERLRNIWHNKFFYGAEIWKYPALTYEKDLIKLKQ